MTNTNELTWVFLEQKRGTPAIVPIGVLPSDTNPSVIYDLLRKMEQVDNTYTYSAGQLIPIPIEGEFKRVTTFIWETLITDDADEWEEPETIKRVEDVWQWALPSGVRSMVDRNPEKPTKEYIVITRSYEFDKGHDEHHKALSEAREGKR